MSIILYGLETNTSNTLCQVCDHGKELLEFLQKPTAPSADESMSRLVDYSGAAQQVLDSIHEVSAVAAQSR